MAFETRYPNRKDRRRQYYGAEAIDGSCRPHCSDPWSRGNRLHATELRRKAAEEQIEEFQNGWAG